MKTAIIILFMITCLSLICVIVLQSGKTSGLSGALSGQSDNFLSKNKANSLDAKLARATKWIAGVFVLLTLALTLI